MEIPEAPALGVPRVSRESEKDEDLAERKRIIERKRVNGFGSAQVACNMPPSEETTSQFFESIITNIPSKHNQFFKIVGICLR